MAHERPSEQTERVAELARRREEITQRLLQLRAHNTAIARRGAQGSSTADMAAAHEAACVARDHAADAYARAAHRHITAAAAHDRAACWFSTAGDDNRARYHRRAAEADREAAALDEHEAQVAAR
ncbi:MAG TPA: hypothetical protein VGE11_05125 [Pseudonocardia sp.]